MNIIDFDEEHLAPYLLCLEDWSEEMKETGHHKEFWYHRMKDRGLRVKLALDEQGTVGGMIQYVPVEYAPVEGADLYFINCIWIHGHNQGRGNFQRQGMGKALLMAAEADVHSLGAKGIAAWGIIFPGWMRASWFKKHGYRIADRSGIRALVWKQFSTDAIRPTWVRPKANPSLEPNKVTVTALCNGWCPAQNLVFERAKRAAGDPQFANTVIFRGVDTFDREEFLRWGVSDGLFINGKQVRTGPPPSYERIRKLINRQTKKVRLPITGNTT